MRNQHWKLKGAILATLVVGAGLVGLAPTASAACDLAGTCAVVLTGYGTGSYDYGCGCYPVRTLHGEASHSSLSGGTGSVLIEGFTRDSCSIGIGGSCRTHGHAYKYNVPAYGIFKVQAKTSAVTGTVSDTRSYAW